MHIFCYGYNKESKYGGYIVQKENRQNRVDTGAFEAKHNRIIDNRDKINLNSREQAYRIKLNRVERERLIAVIKARQSILRIGETQQMRTNREEQVIVAQQTRNEVKVITQNIPAEMAVGPLRALVTRILGKLPEKAYKYLSATVILSMALSACSAINRSKEFETDQAESPAATAMMPDSVSDDGAAIEVTPSVAATETAQSIDLVEDLLSRYLAGEDIDVSTLTQEEFIEFSAKLAEEKNETRGINPIILNNEYMDPSDLKFKDYDGHPDMNETIQMYVPIAGKDEQGNLQFMVNGQLATIPHSANVDWNMQITDPYDTRIDWPKTSPLKATGMPEAQSMVKDFGIVLNPMVFLGKQVGELKLDSNVGTFDTLSTLSFYDIETDAVGNPVLARMILTIGVNYNLFEEGGTLDTQAFMGQVPENSYVYQGLQANAVYYAGISPRQTEDFEQSRILFDGNQGIIAGDRSLKVITGQETNDKDMVVANANILIRKTTNTAK